MVSQDLVVWGVAAALMLLLVSLALGWRTLQGLPRGGDLQVLRLLAEQTLAGHRSEAEQSRALLSNTERALGGRLDAVQLAMEQRLGQLTTGIARDQGKSRVLLEAKLGERPSTPRSAWPRSRPA